MIEQPCLHQHDKRGEYYYYLCNNCHEFFDSRWWIGWEAAIAAVRARGQIIALSKDVRIQRLMRWEHDDFMHELGMEMGQDYMLVALPVEKEQADG